MTKVCAWAYCENEFVPHPRAATLVRALNWLDETVAR